jgi:signal transduction histidine kinase
MGAAGIAWGTAASYNGAAHVLSVVAAQSTADGGTSMMLAFVRVLPVGVGLVLLLLTAASYWQMRRRYLLVWMVVWALATVYYFAQLLVVASSPEMTSRETFERLGVVATSLGWARAIGIWIGARALVGRGFSRRGAVAVVVLSVIWVVLATLVMEARSAALLTRTSYGLAYLAAAAVLLLHRPRTTTLLFTAGALLCLGLLGVTNTWLVMDATGNIVITWLANTLMLTVGLGVLARVLEEERELATARSQELAAANARLAELDRLKSDFVSMVSHELRTPLGLIKGYAGTLLRDDAPLDHETRKEFLQVIDEETDRLTELVTNLLDMSRIEAGTLRIERHPVEINHLLADCAERLRAREPTRALQLQMPQSLPAVLADERRVAQVVDNLLTNATRYSPEPTPIRLVARAVNGDVEVRVVDEGIGIPTDKLDQVFEKFFRVDTSDTRRFAGTGLGLAICRGIVQAHGGRIWVHSTPGQGSTFAFTIPVCQESPSEPD